MISRSLIQQLCEYDTALIANTIGFLDTTPADQWYMSGQIQSVTPTLGPTVGVAVTCEMDSSSPGNAPEMDPFWRQLEKMQSMNIPVVWVVKAIGSRPEHECIIGDGMAKLLHTSGCVGLVTDGGVRDVSGLLTTPLATYCRGTVIHHCALRIRATDQPVKIGGITVSSGDLIHANAEGVIKIPPGCLGQLPEKCSAMRQLEHEVHRIWRQTDVSIADKRKIAGEIFTNFGFTHANELTNVKER
jgi:regulator of RNase E activity RraA